MNWLVVLASVGLWVLVGALWLALDPGRLRVAEEAFAEEVVAEEAFFENAVAAGRRDAAEDASFPENTPQTPPAKPVRPGPFA